MFEFNVDFVAIKLSSDEVYHKIKVSQILYIYPVYGKLSFY